MSLLEKTNLVEEYKNNPNLTKEWVKSLLKRINERSENLNSFMDAVKERLDDENILPQYWDIIEEFEVEYSVLQEELMSFHSLFLEI